MTKIFCSDMTCRFVGRDGFCEKDRIDLSYCIRNKDEYQEYHLCRSKERDPDYGIIQDAVRKVIKGNCDNAV